MHDAVVQFKFRGLRAAGDELAGLLATFVEAHKQPVDILAESLKEFHPKEALQTVQMADLDGIVKDAVGLKFLDAPMTKEQLTEFLQIPPAK